MRVWGGGGGGGPSAAAATRIATGDTKDGVPARINDRQSELHLSKKNDQDVRPARPSAETPSRAAKSPFPFFSLQRAAVLTGLRRF